MTDAMADESWRDASIDRGLKARPCVEHFEKATREKEDRLRVESFEKTLGCPMGHAWPHILVPKS